MKLNPIGNKLVVLPDLVIEKKVGNLIIPAGLLTEKVIRGTIIAVGPGKRNPKTGITISLDIEPGDRVVLNKYAGSRIFIDQKEIMLIDISEILCVEEG